VALKGDQSSPENVKLEIQESEAESFESEVKESPKSSISSLRKPSIVLEKQESQSTETRESQEKALQIKDQIKVLDKGEKEAPAANKVKDPQVDQNQWTRMWYSKVDNERNAGPSRTIIPFGQKQEENKMISFTITKNDEIEEISLLEDSSDDDEISMNSDESEAHLITIGDDDDEQTGQLANHFPIGSTPAVATKPTFHANISPIQNSKPKIVLTAETNDADNTLMPEELEEGEVPSHWKFTGPLHNGYYTSGMWYDTPEGLVILTDYKEKCSEDIYFPKSGPYWCEICHDVVETNKEFVAHVRNNHLDVADQDVLHKMEIRLQQ
jgi:hypothetical protein